MVASIVNYTLLSPKDFVLLCADIMEAEGFKEVRVLEGPGDWKEDISADEIIFSQSGVYEVLHFKVQCKHYAKSGNKVSPTEVNEMFPYLFSTDANRLLIVTDTDLTTQAKQEINSFNKKNPIKKVIYWIERDVENRLLKHRWILNKYFPSEPELKIAHSDKIFNPYKMLEFYRETDFKYFFGRSTDIKILAESVYKNKTIILFGESGVGKTSLLHAGLFPLLRRENWIIISSRCLDKPVENIRREALIQIGLQNEQRIEIDRLKKGVKFADFLSELSQISNSLGLKILIVLDQAEELFTLCDEDDRNTFSEGLTVFLNSNEIHGTFSLLLSLRNDYVGDLRSWARSKHALDSAFSWDGLHCIGRFTVEQARLAIAEPAKRLNVLYDNMLLEQLLNDLLAIGNGFVYQPYLQIVCSTLFEEALKDAGAANNFVICPERYESLNRAMGIITSFFSEKLWVDFSQKEQTIARNIAKSLTTSEGLRHQLTLGELADATGENKDDIAIVLKRLIDKRLVHRVIIEQEVEPVYELIHDFLGKQIANQLSEEEKHCKEAEELLSEALRRWKKHGVVLSEREITVLEEYGQKLRFKGEEMGLIFTSLLDKSLNLLQHKIWFESFGSDAISTFVKAYLSAEGHILINFDKVVSSWTDELVNQLTATVLTTPELKEDDKVGRYLALLAETKNPRVLNDPKVIDLAFSALDTKLGANYVVSALKILMATRKGIDLLKNSGDKAIRIMIDTIHDGWNYGGQWYGTPTWFSRYRDQYAKIFIELSRDNIALVINLLHERIWHCGKARESENLVDAFSLVSNDVNQFRRILLNHWTAYAQLAAVRALTKIGSEEAINALIEGLSSQYSTVLRDIIIALAQKGTVTALPALEKLTEDPFLSESNIGYLQKTIQKIKMRASIP